MRKRFVSFLQPNNLHKAQSGYFVHVGNNDVVYNGIVEAAPAFSTTAHHENLRSPDHVFLYDSAAAFRAKIVNSEHANIAVAIEEQKAPAADPLNIYDTKWRADFTLEGQCPSCKTVAPCHTLEPLRAVQGCTYCTNIK
jgi:hypothetical protein